jgi:hypothetical protein
MSKFHDDKSRDVLGCDGLLHCVHQERMYSQVPDKDLDIKKCTRLPCRCIKACYLC